MKITKITPAQAARFGEWSKKWIEIGLSTEPADFDRATEAALKAYKLCNLGRPMVILRMSSPYGATVGGALAWTLLREFDLHVEQHVGQQVRQQVEQQVEQQVRQQVWRQVEQQVRRQVWQQVGQQVRQQVDQQVRQHSFKTAGDGFGNYGINSLWSSWGAYVSFIRDVLGWNDPVLTERFAIDEALMQSCGWTWWHQNVLAISDRPCALNRDSEGRLHCPGGPSIAYRDGWALHHWHGVLMPDYVIERPAEIKPEVIGAERNAEVRRVMIERYGTERYLLDSGAEQIASDRFGTLYRKTLANDEPIVMVKVRNSTPEPDGSVRDYFLRVPPDTRTAAAACAWTFGLGAKEYAPEVET